MSKEVAKLTEEQKGDLRERFEQLDLDGNGYLDASEVLAALNMLNIRKASYQIRDIIEEFKLEAINGTLTLSEFEKLYVELRLQDHGFTAKMNVKAKEGLENYTSQYEHANIDIKHSVRIAEEIAFSNWISRKLENDPVCTQYFPFNESGNDLYEKCRDGVILCKIINCSVPDTIDMRALNTSSTLSVFHQHENIVLALNSARAIGCNVINIRSSEIVAGVKHLLLGLLWQIIKVGLLAEVNLAAHSELARLAREEEELEDLRKLSPVDLLLRWVNYQLKKAGCENRITNFSSDIRDSVVYSYLIKQVAPSDKPLKHPDVRDILREEDWNERAEKVLVNAECIDARAFVTADNITSGNANLNMAFVANLFNLYSNMEQLNPEDLDGQQSIIQETREEKTFRNWINSIVSPYVNYLYSDLCDGLIYFLIYDQIRSNIVKQQRVNKTFSKLKAKFQVLENCNYVVELGKECRFSLVGIAGSDLQDGNPTLTLALVWQLMRAYTLSVLSKLTKDGKPIEDKMILEWANSVLESEGKKSHINSFQDQSLHTALAIVDLVDAVKPGSINYDLVRKDDTPENCFLNAKYAISVARKIGSKVYVLPEDITEVNAKMILTIVACLMIVSLEGVGH